MGYEIKPDGTIVAQTMDEAIALSQKLSQRAANPLAHSVRRTVGPASLITPVQRAPNPENGSRRSRSAAPGSMSPEKMRAILGWIVAGGKGGIQGLVLAERLNLKDPRGLSANMRAIHKAIAGRANGRARDAFLRKERTSKGAVWYANADRLREIGLLDEA